MRGVRSFGVPCLALVVLVLACSACGSSSKLSGSTPTTAGLHATVATDAACTLITQADAAKLFGTDARQLGDPMQGEFAKSACLWAAKDDTKPSYLLQVRVYDRPDYFSGSVSGYQPLAGVGDRAAIRVLPDGSEVTISYQKGLAVTTVSYGIHAPTAGSGGAVPRADAQKDQLIALVTMALAR